MMRFTLILIKLTYHLKSMNYKKFTNLMATLYYIYFNMNIITFLHNELIEFEKCNFESLITPSIFIFHIFQ